MVHISARPSPTCWYGASELAACIASVCAPHPLDLSDALALSGVAFRTYIFNAGDNYNYAEVHPGERVRWDSLDAENYGVMESLGVLYERDVRMHSHPSGAEFISLVRQECAGGRTIWARIPALSKSLLACAPDPCRESDLGIDITREMLTETLKGVEFALTVRPPRESVSARRRQLLWLEVIRFALAHARTGRELVHGQDLFFATGQRAWETAIELAATLTTNDVDESAFLTAWIHDVQRARHHAATFLRRWAEETSPMAPRAPGGTASLRSAAEFYTQTANALTELSDAIVDGWHTRRGSALRQLDGIRERDQVAFRSLSAVLEAS